MDLLLARLERLQDLVHNLIAGGAPGHPDPDLLISSLVVEQRRDDVVRQRREGLGVAEEARHADEEAAVHVEPFGRRR